MNYYYYDHHHQVAAAFSVFFGLFLLQASVANGSSDFGDYQKALGNNKTTLRALCAEYTTCLEAMPTELRKNPPHSLALEMLYSSSQTGKSHLQIPYKDSRDESVQALELFWSECIDIRRQLPATIVHLENLQRTSPLLPVLESFLRTLEQNKFTPENLANHTMFPSFGILLMRIYKRRTETFLGIATDTWGLASFILTITIFAVLIKNYLDSRKTEIDVIRLGRV